MISVVSASAAATTRSPSPQALRRAFEDIVVQKDAPAEQVAFDLAQCGFLADVVPCIPDSADLPVDIFFAAFSLSWKLGAAAKKVASVLVRLPPRRRTRWPACGNWWRIDNRIARAVRDRRVGRSRTEEFRSAMRRLGRRRPRPERIGGANRAVGMVSRMFELAIAWDMTPARPNPCRRWRCPLFRKQFHDPGGRPGVQDHR